MPGCDARPGAREGDSRRWRRNRDHIDHPGDYQGEEEERKSRQEGAPLLFFTPKEEKIVDQRVLNKQNRMRENYDIFLGRDDSTDGNGAKNEERKKAEGHLVVNICRLQKLHFFIL